MNKKLSEMTPKEKVKERLKHKGITIDGAIKRQMAILTGKVNPYNDESIAAIQLGIEALKRIRDMRVSSSLGYYTRLPGETEESVNEK